MVVVGEGKDRDGVWGGGPSIMTGSAVEQSDGSRARRAARLP